MSPDTAHSLADLEAISSADLASKGLAAADLCDAVRMGHEEAIDCTAFDVISRAGYVRWSTPLRILGEIYVDKGFTRERPKGFEMLVSPDRTFALAVAPGDPRTGNPERMPSTRIVRGPLTAQAIAGNRHQLGFGDIGSAFVQEIGPTTKIWLLLNYFDDLLNEIRVELSLPVEFKPSRRARQRGHVTVFEPRMFLPKISLSDVATIDTGADEPIDVPVLRRSS